MEGSEQNSCFYSQLKRRPAEKLYTLCGLTAKVFLYSCYCSFTKSPVMTQIRSSHCSRYIWDWMDRIESQPLLNLLRTAAGIHFYWLFGFFFFWGVGLKNYSFSMLASHISTNVLHVFSGSNSLEGKSCVCVWSRQKHLYMHVWNDNCPDGIQEGHMKNADQTCSVRRKGRGWYFRAGWWLGELFAHPFLSLQYRDVSTLDLSPFSLQNHFPDRYLKKQS